MGLKIILVSLPVFFKETKKSLGFIVEKQK